MDWGEQAVKIQEAATANGGDIPPLPFLINKPERAEHLDFEWRAFRDLSSDRQSGFNLGRIPWSSLDRYAQRYRIDDLDEFERLVHLMMEMDTAFRNYHEDKTPPPSSSQPK